MKKVVVILGLLGMYMSAFAVDYGAIAVTAYKAKNYPLAIENWNKEARNPKAKLDEVYFNMANALMQEKDYAQAIYFYESAIRQNYNLSEAHYNLNIAKAKLKLESNESTDFFGNFKKLLYLPSENFLKWSIILLAWGFLILYFFNLRMPNDNFRRGRNISAGLLVVLFIWLMALNKQITNHDYAIVMKQNVRTEDENQKETGSVLPLGSKVSIVDRIDDKIQVKADNDSLYWVEAQALRTI